MGITSGFFTTKDHSRYTLVRDPRPIRGSVYFGGIVGPVVLCGSPSFRVTSFSASPEISKAEQHHVDSDGHCNRGPSSICPSRTYSRAMCYICVRYAPVSSSSTWHCRDSNFFLVPKRAVLLNTRKTPPLLMRYSCQRDDGSSAQVFTRVFPSLASSPTEP